MLIIGESLNSSRQVQQGQLPVAAPNGSNQQKSSFLAESILAKDVGFWLTTRVAR